MGRKVASNGKSWDYYMRKGGGTTEGKNSI